MAACFRKCIRRGQICNLEVVQQKPRKSKTESFIFTFQSSPPSEVLPRFSHLNAWKVAHLRIENIERFVDVLYGPLKSGTTKIDPLNEEKSSHANKTTRLHSMKSWLIKNGNLIMAHGKKTTVYKMGLFFIAPKQPKQPGGLFSNEEGKVDLFCRPRYPVCDKTFSGPS